MTRPSILHMFTPAANLSPFDVNMAIDAGWQHCMAYTGIARRTSPNLTQDAIFSRGPKGVRRTGIFLGGRDIQVAMRCWTRRVSAMVPPFEVSVFADPSGAFTTAAGMVACAAKAFAQATGQSGVGDLQGRRAVVFGGTGPVGMACAVLAARAGAQSVIVSHQDLARAKEAVATCVATFGDAIPERQLSPACASDDAGIRGLLGEADLVFSAARAGVEVIAARHLDAARDVRVLCDVNAVPPAGIAGVEATADAVPHPGTPRGALAIGALAVGNVKYRAQQALLRQMLEADGPVFLDLLASFEVARVQA
jgi:methylene-tetrahydromethanopterin dehydrogenase